MYLPDNHRIPPQCCLFLPAEEEKNKNELYQNYFLIFLLHLMAEKTHENNWILINNILFFSSC